MSYHYNSGPIPGLDRAQRAYDNEMPPEDNEGPHYCDCGEVLTWAEWEDYGECEECQHEAKEEDD